MQTSYFSIQEGIITVFPMSNLVCDSKGISCLFEAAAPKQM